MDERLHLHEGERLLCSMRPSPALLLGSWLLGIIDALVAGTLLLVVFVAIWWFAAGSLAPWPLWPFPFVIAYLFSAYLRYHAWRSASLRVTTERILVDHPSSSFGMSLTTIKWAQYQESHGGSAGFFDVFFGSRALCIRYGTADTERESCFPSLRMTKDLKHYLDKVDSALRQGAAGEVRPFVAKKRGLRD